jgi:hypothetical protein
MTGVRDKAERLLVLGVHVIKATQCGQIEAIRAELLSWKLDAALQDDLSGVLAQLRVFQSGIKS